MSEERVLPLVLRLERDDQPLRTAALEAGAIAVLSMLSDPRALDGSWTDAVQAWEGHRIRKVVRRARGSGWDRAQALDGLTIEHAGAQVRVFPPILLDEWPRDLAQLQVAGTDLPLDEPPAPTPDGPIIWLAPDQPMTAGKAMAQAGHAAQLAWWRTAQSQRDAWRGNGFALSVRTASAATWDALRTAGLPEVRDAGFTEVEPGSRTAIAEAPWLLPAR